ncbi:MAG: outer membrane beta-barrel protein [Cyclobacteriaceae bacterium]|nr:outer membrane beta-barrel protein [Cyclobacteriaceae bacterium]
MKKIFISALIIAGFAINTNAQTSYWTFSWPISMGIGSTNEYIAKTSFRGIAITGASFLTDNISIGGEWSWEVFDEIKRDLPPREVSVDGVPGHVSGTEYRYLNTIPIFVNSHYYLGQNGALRPYVGMGIGTVYVDQRTDIGFVNIQTQTWRFGVQPEVGVFIPMGLSGVGVSLKAKYRYATKASDAEAVNMFSFGLGFGFMN